MKLNLLFILLFSNIYTFIHAQDKKNSFLNIGDPAPALQIQSWLKGHPVHKFEKGKIYVIEFWATWCIPCKAAMPRISELAKKYKNQITVLGIDVLEEKSTQLRKIKSFVDSMGNRMNYLVGLEKGDLMVTHWLDAFDERKNGIPRTFVIDREGRVAWIGYPANLEKIIPHILDNTWDMKAYTSKRKLNRELEYLDSIADEQLRVYKNFLTGNIEKPDSCLAAINEIVQKEKKLKFTPMVTYYTFNSLLKTNPDKAFEFGKMAVNKPNINFPNYDIIINAINRYADSLNFPTKIYELGADSYQKKIDDIPYPEIADMPKLYNKMAKWYWKANDTTKALAAEKMM